MLVKAIVAATAFIQVVQAHFAIQYPPWRADSFDDPYNQNLRPCAGVNSSGNRTAWPLDGGSVALELHHPWDYVFINLGIDNGVINFNISLTPNLFNNTGNGTLCLPKIQVPASLNIQDGQNASIQVVTVNNRGNALYNCADIVFSSNATLLQGDQCKNTTIGPLFVIEDQTKGGNQTKGGDKTPSAAIHGYSLPVFTTIFTILMAMIVASGLL